MLTTVWYIFLLNLTTSLCMFNETCWFLCSFGESGCIVPSGLIAQSCIFATYQGFSHWPWSGTEYAWSRQWPFYENICMFGIYVHFHLISGQYLLWVFTVQEILWVPILTLWVLSSPKVVKPHYCLVDMREAFKRDNPSVYIVLKFWVESQVVYLSITLLAYGFAWS